MKNFIILLFILLIAGCNILIPESRYRYDGAEIILVAEPNSLLIENDDGYQFSQDRSNTIISKHILNNLIIWEFTRDTIEYRHTSEIPIWLRLEVIQIINGDGYTLYKCTSLFSDGTYDVVLLKNNNNWVIALNSFSTNYKINYRINNRSMKIYKELNAKFE